MREIPCLCGRQRRNTRLLRNRRCRRKTCQASSVLVLAALKITRPPIMMAVDIKWHWLTPSFPLRPNVKEKADADCVCSRKTIRSDINTGLQSSSTRRSGRVPLLSLKRGVVVPGEFSMLRRRKTDRGPLFWIGLGYQRLSSRDERSSKQGSRPPAPTQALATEPKRFSEMR